MGRYTRGILAGPVLALALGAGLGLTPGTASAAGISGRVQVRSSLMVRTAPGLGAPVVRALHNGQRVTVQCSVAGDLVRGSVRTTNRWDRLSDGTYLTDAYLWTVKAVPRCASSSPQAQHVRAKPLTSAAYKVGTVRSTDGRVNIRTAPSTTAPVTRAVPSGTKLALVCGVVGTRVSGTVRATTQWNRLTDGTYISHAYLVTPTLHLCRGASVPPVTTPSTTPAQFVAAAVPGAQLGWRQYGVPPSVTIAQAILESGWGRSNLSVADRNYFGIKCQNGKFGTLANGCHVYRTTECAKDGSCFTTTASFRTYASMSRSFRDHGNFLRVNSRYRPAFAYTRNANNFIWRVWKAGYATDPKYYTKITTLMATYNLYKYDTWK